MHGGRDVQRDRNVCVCTRHPFAYNESAYNIRRACVNPSHFTPHHTPFHPRNKFENFRPQIEIIHHHLMDRNLTYISHFVAWESQSEEGGGNGRTMVERITLLQARRSKNYASARRRTA